MSLIVWSIGMVGGPESPLLVQPPPGRVHGGRRWSRARTPSQQLADANNSKPPSDIGRGSPSNANDNQTSVQPTPVAGTTSSDAPLIMVPVETSSITVIDNGNVTAAVAATSSGGGASTPVTAAPVAIADFATGRHHKEGSVQYNLRAMEVGSSDEVFDANRQHVVTSSNNATPSTSTTSTTVAPTTTMPTTSQRRSYDDGTPSVLTISSAPSSKSTTAAPAASVGVEMTAVFIAIDDINTSSPSPPAIFVPIEASTPSSTVSVSSTQSVSNVSSSSGVCSSAAATYVLSPLICHPLM
jgi:hypothetical protein